MEGGGSVGLHLTENVRSWGGRAPGMMTAVKKSALVRCAAPVAGGGCEA